MNIPDPAPAWNALLSAWDAWLLTFVLAVVVPVLGYVRFRRLLTQPDAGTTARAKLTVYFRTMVWQWILVAAMAIVVRRHGLSMTDVGERVGDARLRSLVTAGVLAIVAVVFAIARRRLARAQPRNAAATNDVMRRLAPRFGREMAAFALLSLTAGICEELLYRGWLINVMWAATGSVWIAVGAAAAMFGIGHAYQGVKGILRTIFIGLQLAVLFVYVGSLIPGQALHAAVDLVGGVLMARAGLPRRLNAPTRRPPY